jgi:formylmethanofuran dehydrogenase subunit E
MKDNYLDLDRCLEDAEMFHGHLCPGIMLGTRMSILGMKAMPCLLCGERVMDMKDVMIDGKYMYRPCAENKRYYRPVNQ